MPDYLPAVKYISQTFFKLMQYEDFLSNNQKGGRMN